MAYRSYRGIFSTGTACHNTAIGAVCLALINLVTGTHEGSMPPSV